MRLGTLIALLALAACAPLSKTSQFTAADAASAAAIASAAGISGDSKCWSDYNAIFTVIENQLADRAGGVASTIELQRSMKAVAGTPECFGITVELLAALSKIPYAGPIAIQVFGF